MHVRFLSSSLVAVAVLLALGACTSATGDSPWRSLHPGVEYAHFEDAVGSWHVTRVDVDHPDLVIFGSDESDRGRTVSNFARQHDAIAAINGDYFDQDLAPIGPSRGFCGDWEVRAAPVSRRQPILVAGEGRVAIIDAEVAIPDWADAAVSGWPRVVSNCRAIPSDELPGSDFFTRAPHMRTAVGISEDGDTLYLVVADRIEDGEFGVTLPQLGTFMRETLRVCEALNLDGGGSSALAIEQRLVSRTKYPDERNVANHLGVTTRSDAPTCHEHDPTRGRAELLSIASRLGLDATAAGSGVRVQLPWDEASILLDDMGDDTLASGSLVTSKETAAAMQSGLTGRLRVSWTTPLDDGRLRVQLGGRIPPEEVERELTKLIGFAERQADSPGSE